MKRLEAKQIIAQEVYAAAGLKMMELISKENVIRIIKEGYDVPELVEELVKIGDLVEIEYNLPHMSYRTKSFLLPGQTNVNLIVRRKGN